MMWKILKYVFSFIFSCIVFIACNKGDGGLHNESVIGEKRDTISLSLEFKGEEICSKAGLNINSNPRVNNVNVYVFNELGDIISHRYTTHNELSDIVIYRSQQYSVYAIANLGESLIFTTVGELEGAVKKISSINELVDASGDVLMSGKTPLQQLRSGQVIPIKMVRCISKFVLKCDYTQLNSGVSIKVKRVQLKNAPASISLFKASKAVKGEVINGEERLGEELVDLSGGGVPFYLFENMQGIVAPAALSNREKEQAMGGDAKANCSYIEMEYDYVSSEKRGTIVYRFYLGVTFADCSIKRNNQYTCTVLFKGNGSAGENSWSVDSGGLVDLVTSVSIAPTSHTFMAPGETLQLISTVLPISANNKTLSWSSSNTAIASVDNNGLVTAVGVGRCTITATSVDGTNISASCDIESFKSEFILSHTSKSFYYKEGFNLSVTTITPSSPITWSSSNPAVASVIGKGLDVVVYGESVGTATITATAQITPTYSITAQCEVSVEYAPLKGIEIECFIGNRGADRLLDSKYYDGASSYNTYGIKVIPNNANPAYKDITWTVDAKNTTQQSRNILLTTVYSGAVYTAHATPLVSTDVSRGPTIITAKFIAPDGGEYTATQDLHVYEYAPLRLVWEANPSASGDDVQGLVRGQLPSNIYNCPSMIPGYLSSTQDMPATENAGYIDLTGYFSIRENGVFVSPKTKDDYESYGVGIPDEYSWLPNSNIYVQFLH